MAVTELLDHRMIGVGRHLWRSPSSTLLLKQVHLELAAQGCIKDGAYISRERDSTTSPVQTVPWFLCQPQNKVLPHVLLELPVHYFLPHPAVALILLLGTTGRCLAPSS